MYRPLRLHEHLLMLALFGGLFVYFIIGALSGDLYIPGRRGPGVHLDGIAAWLFVAAAPLLYAAILVRHQNLFPSIAVRSRTAVEFILLFGGVGAMLVGIGRCYGT